MPNISVDTRLMRWAVLGTSIATCLCLTAVAFAQSQGMGSIGVGANGECRKIITIPAEIDPGVYDLEATGIVRTGSYPPSRVSISTDKNIVVAGEQVTVFCEGFVPNSQVTLRLQLVVQTEAMFSLAQATETRTVSTRLLILDPDDDRAPAARGSTTIISSSSSASSSAAAAAAAGAGRDTKTVVKAGADARSKASSSADQAKGKGKLAFTGIDALPLAAAALGALLLGTVLLGAARKRRNAGSDIVG